MASIEVIAIIILIVKGFLLDEITRLPIRDSTKKQLEIKFVKTLHLEVLMLSYSVVLARKCSDKFLATWEANVSGLNIKYWKPQY